MIVESVDLANNFSMVIAKDKDGEKRVFGFGENKNSKLSDKILSDEVVIPTEIELFHGIRPQTVNCGSFHTFITTEAINSKVLRSTHH